MNEKKQFQAESQRLLDLMIHSIYTHKEIFLREIISNASDAIDKLCYLALTDNGVGMKREDFAITLTLDKQNRTLTVSDNGIGMNAAELENNLGIIASSGSLRFREAHGQEDTGTDIIPGGTSHHFQHHSSTQTEAVLEQQALGHNLIFPDTVCILGKQFLLFLCHGCQQFI